MLRAVPPESAVEQLVKHLRERKGLGWRPCAGWSGMTPCPDCDRLLPLAEAELAARSEETLIDRDVGMEVIYLGRCDDGLPYLVGPGRYAIRPLPDAKPEPVAVWERPEHAGAPYMCSACSTPLCEGHLGGMCPICALPLASTPSPWPGTTDELAAQERAAKGG